MDVEGGEQRGGAVATCSGGKSPVCPAVGQTYATLGARSRPGCLVRQRRALRTGSRDLKMSGRLACELGVGAHDQLLPGSCIPCRRDPTYVAGTDVAALPPQPARPGGVPWGRQRIQFRIRCSVTSAYFVGAPDRGAGPRAPPGSRQTAAIARPAPTASPGPRAMLRAAPQPPPGSSARATTWRCSLDRLRPGGIVAAGVARSAWLLRSCATLPPCHS